MQRLLHISCLGLPALLLLSACGRNPDPPAQIYEVRGVVKRLAPADNRIWIHHEAIPSFMSEMTMPFHVRDTNELDGLELESKISFRLHVTGEDSWVDQIKRLEGSAEPVVLTNQLPATGSFRVVRDVEPLEIGDLLPNYTLTNELGDAVELHDFKGKALAITFLYTRCPLPNFCPLMARNLGRIYAELRGTENAPTNWHLLAISFDPERDTPPVLQEFAQRYYYDPALWSFLTGAYIDIDALTEQFSLSVVRQGEEWDHQLRTILVGPDLRIRQIVRGNTWDPGEFAKGMLDAAREAAPARAPDPSVSP